MERAMDETVLEINVTEFKATCLALFKELEARRYDKVVVTRRGRPIAQLTPAVSEVPDLYGALKGRVIIPPGVDLTEPVLEDIPEAESGEGPFF
jgi:antitoxin (DNA-binding transcriptional repressor) of toxin-antitoxin stability system